MPSEATTRLKLPFIAASQAQKHVTHNEALAMIDTLLQCGVESRTVAPPPVPVDGACHIVPPAAAGPWAGRDGDIARHDAGGWVFHEPRTGWMAWVADEAKQVVFDGTAWQTHVAGVLSTLPALGLNAATDPVNRLTVKSDAVLFSHDDVTPGSGDTRLKVNKAAAAKTASLLFQDAWSGRAEMGLAGNDDFSIKVSANGTQWATAFVADRATGRVSFPGGGARQMLTAATTWFIRTDGSDANSGDANTAAGAFRTIAGAWNAIARRIDAAGQAVTFQLADGTYSDTVILALAIPNAASVTLRGNAANPASVQVSPSGYGGFTVSGVSLEVSGLTLSNAGPLGQGALVSNRGVLTIGQGMAFAACPNRCHLEVTAGSSLSIAQNYSINGSAPNHILLANQSMLTASSRTVTLAGTPAFPQGFIQANQGATAVLFANIWNGAATGPRYRVTGNSVIDAFAAGPNHLPGDTAGISASGGIYV
jgi:hypothetical protein